MSPILGLPPLGFANRYPSHPRVDGCPRARWPKRRASAAKARYGISTVRTDAVPSPSSRVRGVNANVRDHSPAAC